MQPLLHYRQQPRICTLRRDSEWFRVNDTPVTDLHYTTVNLPRTNEYEFRVAAVNKSWMSDSLRCRDTTL